MKGEKMFTIQQSKTFAPEKKNRMFLRRIIITACISQSQKRVLFDIDENQNDKNERTNNNQML